MYVTVQQIIVITNYETDALRHIIVSSSLPITHGEMKFSGLGNWSVVSV